MDQLESTHREEAEPVPGFSVVFAPHRVDLSGKGKSIFLAGSIDQGEAIDWQTSITQKLSNLPVTILNPRRSDWDSSWEEDITFEPFREQVEWEQDMLQAADVIALYFAPASKAPISLLELGLFARTGKMVVACPPGYWKRGNVQIVCERLKVELVDSKDKLVQSVERKVHSLLVVAPVNPSTIRTDLEKPSTL
jgi:Nucleoside 2-deoxyribosyltransferase like